EVQRVALEPGGARLVVETLGIPRLGGTPAAKGCGPVPHVRTIDVASADAGSAADLDAALGPLLSTPEAYLAAHGTPFELAPVKTRPSVAAGPAPEGNDDERRLGRQVPEWPKVRLAVDPVYYDLSGKAHYQSELAFDAIVAVDGRLYQPALRT